MAQAELAIRTGLAEKTVSQIANGIAPLNYDLRRRDSSAAKGKLKTRRPALLEAMQSFCYLRLHTHHTKFGEDDGQRGRPR